MGPPMGGPMEELMEEPLAAPPAGPEGIAEDNLAAGQLFTDQQVSYHGPQEICGTCDYFQPPNGCLVVSGPKDESGWCVLHSARAVGTAPTAGAALPPGMGEVE